MARKSLFYHLFRLGRIPSKYRPSLEAEGILCSDEGIPGWFSAATLRTPQRRSAGLIEGFCGSLVVTRHRFAAYALRNPLINVPLDDPRLADLALELPSPERLIVTFDLAKFRDDSRGIIKIRFTTSIAREVFEQVQRAQKRFAHAPTAEKSN